MVGNKADLSFQAILLIYLNLSVEIIRLNLCICVVEGMVANILPETLSVVRSLRERTARHVQAINTGSFCFVIEVNCAELPL